MYFISYIILSVDNIITNACKKNKYISNNVYYFKSLIRCRARALIIKRQFWIFEYILIITIGYSINCIQNYIHNNINNYIVFKYLMSICYEKTWRRFGGRRLDFITYPRYLCQWIASNAWTKSKVVRSIDFKITIFFFCGIIYYYIRRPCSEDKNYTSNSLRRALVLTSFP